MNILLTCAGRRGYLVDYFREVVAPLGGKVFAANSTEYAVALHVADAGFILPPLISETYMDRLVELCVELQIDLIVPLFDQELLALAENRQRFLDQGIQVLVSDVEVIKRCNDKWLTYQYLTSHNLPTPATFLSIELALDAVAKGSLSYPLIVKPRWGAGSNGIAEAVDEDELRVFYRKLERIGPDPAWAHHLPLPSMASDTVLIQPKVTGAEYGLDVINDLSAQYVTTFVRHKLAMRSGETDIATMVDDPVLQRLGQSLGELVKHIANLDVDVFVDSSGQALILEMNARFGGGYPFAHMAGANLPAAIVAWLMNKVPDAEWLTVTEGVTAYKSIQLLVAGHSPSVRL